MTLAGAFVRSGKVRDLYDLDARAARARRLGSAVARSTSSCRRPIPDKGRVLTGLSRFWFAETRSLVPNHLLSTDPTDLPVEAAEAAELRGRTMICRRTQVLPVEVIVRGYVAGSGWKDYRRTGSICGHPAAGRAARERSAPGADLDPVDQGRSRDARREHRSRRDDRPDGRAAVDDRPLGAAAAGELAEQIRAAALAVYGYGSAIAARGRHPPGRHEVRVRPAPDGELLLIDEVLTPDSSRFWDAAAYEPGRAAGELRQAVRARLAGDPAMGQDGPRAGAPGRGRRGHPGPLRRGVRTDHRRHLRPLS